MARNRQRAKDRKQRQQRDPGLAPLDDASGEIVDPAIAGGAPPDDLGTAPPVVDFDDDDGRDEDDDASDVVGAGAGDVAAPPAAAKPSGVPRFVTFLRACWAELQRVQWPDRKQVGQATAVVLGFVVIAGAFLGLADVVAQRIVNFIL
ncbi:MAG TPA: preprotein translocase subunit SecE [Solirubrobacteraceae bacterium]|jgi:preprotein translocase SecE subunit|nr:preprotein translocase subunit SecE [Solirubrobacteraceae bacterium]